MLGCISTFKFTTSCIRLHILYYGPLDVHDIRLEVEHLAIMMWQSLFAYIYIFTACKNFVTVVSFEPQRSTPFLLLYYSNRRMVLFTQSAAHSFFFLTRTHRATVVTSLVMEVDTAVGAEEEEATRTGCQTLGAVLKMWIGRVQNSNTSKKTST